MARASALLRLAALVLSYGGFAAAIGFFSTAPAYDRYPPEQALLTLSFSHAAQRKEACVRLTPEQIAALPPQQRKPLDCSRARWPLRVELWLDDQRLYAGVAKAAGVARDGVATVYRNFPIAGGRYQVRARLADGGGDGGFAYERDAVITLAAGERFIIDFRSDQNGFLFGAE